MRFTHEQEQLLAKALLAAFYDVADLGLMVRSRLGVFLGDATAGGTREAVVWHVIDYFQQRYTSEKLLAAAQAARPHVPELRQLADQVLVQPADWTALERRLSEVPYLDPAVFRQKQEAIEPAVCSITLTGRSVTGGTGFLVDADLLLTSAHVLQPVVDGTVRPENAEFRFDYKRDRDGHPASLGVTYGLARDHWLELHDAALDFALVRLDARAGEEPIGSRKAEDGAPRRGWIDIPQGPVSYRPDAPLVILHHPGGKELKLIMETKSIVKVSDDGTRLRHRTNTNGGSSGAPCFDLFWTLLGIHRGTIPSQEENEAVPITVVARAIRDGKGTGR